MNLRNTQKSPTFKKYNLALTISIVFALFFWIITLNQPLIDKHEFRQTQTALTVLFNPNLIFNFLNYKTPVLGFPWQIPFAARDTMFATLLANRLTNRLANR